MKTFAIGIDVGATNIKGGVVTKDGKLLDNITVETKADYGPTTVIKQIHFVITELLSKHKESQCYGIGIGVPGIVMVNEQIVKYPPNFRDWEEVALGNAIRKFFSLPVFIDNDANVAAQAEAKFGLGIEYKDFLFVIWGTGVGGGIVINRQVYHGPHGAAGEIGHISIDYNGPKCNCGAKGCIESYIGQKYLSQRAREIIESTPIDGIPSKIVKLVEGKLNKIDPQIIATAAIQGDSIAISLLEDAGNLLGYALSSVINVLDIRIIVIGGGLSAAPTFVFNAIEKSIKENVLKVHKPAVRVFPSVLLNNAGIIGAANLVF